MRDHPGHDVGALARAWFVGSLIVHVIYRTAAGCTLDEEPDGRSRIELRHKGDPTDCVAEWGGCNYCGVHFG